MAIITEEETEYTNMHMKEMFIPNKIKHANWNDPK